MADMTAASNDGSMQAEPTRVYPPPPLEGEVWLSVHGPDAFYAEYNKYVENHRRMAKDSAAQLVARGVDPDRIVYVSRNDFETRGAVYYNFEDFDKNALKLFTLERGSFPVGGYELESFALDGDDFDIVRRELEVTWKASPSVWKEYVANRTATKKPEPVSGSVDSATSGVAALNMKTNC